MATSAEQCLSILEDTALLMQKAQTNLKKCPKQRLTKGYIETRIQTINQYWDTFRRTHQELIKCVSKEKRLEMSYFVNEDYCIYEDLYSCLLADLRDLLSTLTYSNPPEPSTTKCGEQPVKLPQIQLPKYSGCYEDWPEFKDLFISLIHNNMTLSNVQKLHYLKLSLSGEAEVLVKTIKNTNANYEQAWKTLEARYGHRRLIVHGLVKKLCFQRKIAIPTASNIKCLLDVSGECLDSLKNLKVSVDSWDPIIIFLVTQKLDSESHQEWERFVSKKDNTDDLPKWTELVRFLEIKFRSLESFTPPSKPVHKGGHVAHASTSSISTSRNCIICDEKHTLCHCKGFTKLEPAERCAFVRKHNLCFNCLAPGHSAMKCRLNMNCRLCNKRHHSLVHTTTPVEPSNIKPEDSPDNVQTHHSQVEDDALEPEGSEEASVEISSHCTTRGPNALLATALVTVRDVTGKAIVLRALVDIGSQATIISERAAQMLRLKRLPVSGSITGVGSTKTMIKHATEFELLSRNDKSFFMTVKAYVMSTRLTKNLPSQTIPISTWSHLNGLLLADPEFNRPGRVDMLLGVEICAQILKGEIIKGPPGTPCAQNTSLGWILFGKIPDDNEGLDFMVTHLNLNLDEMLKNMWELDDYSKKTLTTEERRCEDIYLTTHSRAPDGRYIVKLPKRTENLCCTQGETRNIAMHRLQQLEKRLERNEYLKREYIKVMEEYEQMNHMEEVPMEELIKPAVYLPHHAVVKDEKETTKVRTVFNASQKGRNNVSLNDELLVGPQLQEDMRNLIMRWRMKRICFTADVQKMYRQIYVTKEDRDLQRVLWRSHPQEPVKDYRLTRVTFGTASAPYLAVKTLQQVAVDEGSAFPEAVKAIMEDFFIDDLMGGNDTVNEAIQAAKDIDTILQKGGFILQKWCSNNAEFLQQFKPSQRSSHANVGIRIDGTIRALGISWDMGKDVFQCRLQLPRPSEIVTKRSILSDMQRLFDPLGWLAPAILPAKLFVQRLWLLGITWDEAVDTKIKNEWFELREALTFQDMFEIKRWLYTTSETVKNITVHGFCDASNRAYAAVAYLRVITTEGDIKISLIAAKTRVAPIKPVTTPRLELCGAVLLSRLLKQIKDAIRVTTNQIFMWTDSTIVLSWLLGDPNRWHTFVRNRVVEVLDNIGNNWYHVQTHENPADIASRGANPVQLRDIMMWWQGPEWLRTREFKCNRPSNLNTSLEQRQIISINMKIELENDNMLANKIDEFDNLPELLKTITYCKRFLKSTNMIDKDGAMTTRELDDALKSCVRITQRASFMQEIAALSENKSITKESKLKSLNPYIDNDNLLRVGGRLKNANLDEDSTHPMILDGKSNLAKIVIANAHLQTLHGGVQLMLSHLRTKFWILKAKNLVKGKIRKCLTCARLSAQARTQLMGDLPKERVTPSRPFLHSGVDFAGPYQILMSRGRGARTSKAYISIFVCMATKAIHLELVGDLTSESFIGAFRRFVARRGKCAHMWSDQGRNFVGANKELITAWNEAKLEFEGPIAEALALDGTQWHFIPPYSPHMGGLWEAGVKSLKHHLRRIMTSHLTFEEMSTLLCQVEACLNSRPLSPVEDLDTDNIQPLTPGHFLIGEAPIAVPGPDLTLVPTNHLSRWQHVQKLLSNFWIRWQQEYLTRLQQRSKWQKKLPELNVGDIVLIKNDNVPPLKWALGRIVAKHPGADGVTRVYSVKSSDCITQRAANKLCLLPINVEP